MSLQEIIEHEIDNNPTQQSDTPEQELVKLRSLRERLLSDLSKLRAEKTELQTKFEASEAARTSFENNLKREKINNAMDNVFERIATKPDVLSSLFQRDYRLDVLDDKLIVLNRDGQPVKNKEGQPYEVSPKGLAALMIESDGASVYEAFLKGSLAAGTANQRTPMAPPEKPKKDSTPIHFGLR